MSKLEELKEADRTLIDAVIDRLDVKETAIEILDGRLKSRDKELADISSKLEISDSMCSGLRDSCKAQDRLWGESAEKMKEVEAELKVEIIAKGTLETQLADARDIIAHHETTIVGQGSVIEKLSKALADVRKNLRIQETDRDKWRDMERSRNKDVDRLLDEATELRKDKRALQSKLDKCFWRKLKRLFGRDTRPYSVTYLEDLE